VSESSTLPSTTSTAPIWSTRPGRWHVTRPHEILLAALHWRRETYSPFRGELPPGVGILRSTPAGASRLTDVPGICNALGRRQVCRTRMTIETAPASMHDGASGFASSGSRSSTWPSNQPMVSRCSV
jgi:hypothetical protein